MNNTVSERILKAQAAVLEHFSKQKDIDIIMEHDMIIAKGDLTDLKEHVTMLAKFLEVIDKNDAIMNNIFMQANFFKYVSKIIKADINGNMTKFVESITLSICNYF
jgi:hypothetical protein